MHPKEREACGTHVTLLLASLRTEACPIGAHDFLRARGDKEPRSISCQKGSIWEVSLSQEISPESFHVNLF